MNGWVGLQPLRVQALMTKLQAERSKLADLESRVLSVQNSLSWEIASKGDVNDSLQRARNKIRRRGELLSLLEGMLREAVDSFDATDRKGSEAKNALSYWASMAVGGSTILTSLTSLGMSCGDRLFEKFGNIFGTGNAGSFVNSIGVKWGENQSTSPLPEEGILGTPAPAEEKSFFESVTSVTKNVSSKLDNSIGWIGNNVQLSEEEAHQRGLNGEKPDGKLLITNPKAYSEQLKAWKSTLSEEELAAYEAELEARERERETEREANKPLYKKIYNKLGDASEGVAKAAKNVAKKAEKKIDAAGEWIEDKAEWAGDKIKDGVEWTGEKIAEGVEDFKVNWNGMIDEGKQIIDNATGEVNDFLEEHPGVGYTVEAVGSTVEFVGSVASFCGKVATNPVGAFVGGYDTTVNKFFNMAQDDVALFNYGVGKIFEAIGTPKANANAQYYYEEAELYSEMDGMAGMLRSEGLETFGDVVTAVDMAAIGYSAVTGGASAIDNFFKGEGVKAIINWTNPENGIGIMKKIGYYDDVISNISIIKDTGESFLEKDMMGIISSWVSPVKSWSKIEGLFETASEIESR